MKLLYIGNNENLTYVVTKHCEKNDIDFIRLPLSDESDIENVADKIISTNKDAVIIDQTSFINSEESFTYALSLIMQASQCKIIIFCNAPSDSRLVSSLKGVGLTNVINTEVMGDIQEKLDHFLDPEYSSASDEPDEKVLSNREALRKEVEIINPNLKKISDKNKEEYPREVIKIAVSGTMPRIGTTTIALQLAKHLNLLEEGSACYIQSNAGYLENLEEYYFTDPHINSGFTYGGLHLYKNATFIQHIISEGYSYIIYDYGVICEANLLSILDKDISIIVAGAGPSEIKSFSYALEQTMRSSTTNYIIYDMPDYEEERKDFLTHMRYKDIDKREQTFFVEHVSDPFIYTGAARKVYDAIMATKVEVNEEIEKKRKPLGRLFGRK